MDNTINVRMQNTLMPKYYNKFKCIADKCKNSCCKNWTITVSEKEVEALKSAGLSDDLNKILDARIKDLDKNFNDLQLDLDSLDQETRQYVAKNIDLKTKYITLEDGNCPFLNEQGLCRIVMENGDKNLFSTCQIYPRIPINETLWGVEYRMDNTCEAVLDLLWNEKDGIEFETFDITPPNNMTSK